MNKLVTNKTRLGFLASGAGSNFLNIIESCRANALNGLPILLISNNSNSGAIQIAKQNNIDYFHISSKTCSDPDLEITRKMKEYNIDLVILAGYMKKIGSEMLAEFPSRILNIHPSLLPRHGGAGMFGEKVHRAVLESRDKKTGATVHLVNEEFDKGRILGQLEVDVAMGDTAESLASKVLAVEHILYPKIISEYIGQINNT